MAEKQDRAEGTDLRIAIPTTGGQLASHFGHCEEFTVFDVEREASRIGGTLMLDAPPHQPGLLPAWLAERGVDVVIAGGMGRRARTLFEERGIHVVVGGPLSNPQEIVESYLAGTLETGGNLCDH